MTLWCELGLHRGFLGSRMTSRRGTLGKDSFEIELSYYNLGDENHVGICDGQFRSVLHKVNVMNEEWFDDWDQSSKRGELEGPVLCQRVVVEASNATKTKASRVLKLLTQGPTKPTLKIPGRKPKLRLPVKVNGREHEMATKPNIKHKPPFRLKNQIAYEDRPDVGVEVKPKLKLTAPKFKFKLKEKRE